MAVIETFSTFIPVTMPELDTAAAPTLNPEYGAYAPSIAVKALARRPTQSIDVGSIDATNGSIL